MQRPIKSLKHRNLPLLLLQAREEVFSRFRPLLNDAGVTEQQSARPCNSYPTNLARSCIGFRLSNNGDATITRNITHKILAEITEQQNFTRSR